MQMWMTDRGTVTPCLHPTSSNLTTRQHYSNAPCVDARIPKKSTFKRHLKRNRCDRKKRKCDARAVEVEQLLSKRRKQVGIRCTLYHFMQGWLRLN